jgi:hypothetical protein
VDEMKRLLLLLAVTMPMTVVSQEVAVASPSTTRISKFSVTGMSAIRALLKLAQSEDVPLGIVEDDQQLCSSEVNYSGTDVTPSTVVAGILSNVHGYTVVKPRGSNVLIVAPSMMRPATARLLLLKDEEFVPVKSNLQGLEVMLWAHVLQILYPNTGSAGSIPFSSNDRIYHMEVKDRTVEGILNEMAKTTHGAWVLRPLPSTLDKLTGDLPFAIFSADGQGDRASAEACVPVPEENQP